MDASWGANQIRIQILRNRLSRSTIDPAPPLERGFTIEIEHTFHVATIHPSPISRCCADANFPRSSPHGTPKITHHTAGRRFGASARTRWAAASLRTILDVLRFFYTENGKTQHACNGVP